MKRHNVSGKSRRAAGFSLLELMVVLLVLSVMMGAVFQQLNLVTQRNSAEQAKLDVFQESRNFMDQMTRDLRFSGYPNPRNFNTGVVGGVTSPVAAVGLVKVSANQLTFEGDVDGDGGVESIQYYLDTTGIGCPCLKRSQTIKLAGDPLTGQATASYQTEVQNVQNGVTGTPAIFEAYDINANPVTLPVDFDANPSTIASIMTIKVTLLVQSPTMDIQTRQFPMATLVSTVNLANCSQAASGQTLSCQ